MKRHLLIILLFLLSLFPVRAQYIAIPDSGFAAKLNFFFPSCMNGNMMDTTCSAIQNCTSLSISGSGIANLSGIEYFHNLGSLNCSDNNLSSLPSNLPTGLNTLTCYNNNLTSLPILPSGLNNLDCRQNQIASIPSLPPSLLDFLCSFNQLTALPALPPNLMRLNCSVNQLTGTLPPLPNLLLYLEVYSNNLNALPALPQSLKELSCSFNPALTALPAILPPNLEKLSCEDDSLTVLPSLPPTLRDFRCSQNPLTQLPQLPDSLRHLNCSYCILDSLPAFPAFIETIYCTANQLTALPALPPFVNILFCQYNQLHSLPTLPNSIAKLFCDYNQITVLPELPSSLDLLVCSNNQLSSLPNIPEALKGISCANNQLMEIPPVPAFMEIFTVGDNPIRCIHNLPYITPMGLTNNPTGYISNTLLSCVPNQTNYSDVLPICIENDTLINPFNCSGTPNVMGYVYTERNLNCILDQNDPLSENIPVKLFDAQNNLKGISYTSNGRYSFANLEPDSFYLKIEEQVLPFQVICSQPTIQPFLLDSANQLITSIHYPLACDNDNDVSVHSIVHQGWVFPGQVHTLQTRIVNNFEWNNLDCIAPNRSGSVTIQVSGPVLYSGTTPGALMPQTNGNTFTYAIANFDSIGPHSFGLKFTTDTTAQAGEMVCAEVTIVTAPTDADTLNNHSSICYSVLNSYDPNMKEVYPTNVEPGYNDWFTYTIHFQNTGTAPAFNIRLKDTLDTHLDLNSFEVMGYSHPARVSINGRVMTVRFDNIMLPDSTTDYDGSMGYFQYRLKPNANLPLGTQIENTAYIYFDYNAPIVTNTTQNNIQLSSGIAYLPLQSTVGIFPNPGKGLYWFKDASRVQSAEVFDVLGQCILNATNPRLLDLSAYPAGIYLARINGLQVVKLVKE